MTPTPDAERTASQELPVISDLRTAGSDGGNFMGYYARGHFDAHVFVQACAEFARANDIWFEPKLDRVRHGYWRTTMIQDDPGEFQFSPSRPGPGAWAVTYIDTFGPSLKERNAQYKMGQISGYDTGAADMMQFAYEHLGGWGIKSAEKFLAAAQAWRRDHKEPGQ